MTRLLHALADTLFPTLCASCGEVLVEGERQLCLGCLGRLALTDATLHDNNQAVRTLLGKIPFEEAFALYEYHPESIARKVVHQMKFHSNSDLCLLMGEQMGQALLRSMRFDGIDLLLPVPLHPLRRYVRGYNQSLLLCQGIAHFLPRPIDCSSLVRRRYTRKQSLQSQHQRAKNVEGAFGVRHPHRLQGRHVLLVDDVMTTGATLTACCDALRTIPDLRISVATLAIAVH